MKKELNLFRVENEDYYNVEDFTDAIIFFDNSNFTVRQFVNNLEKLMEVKNGTEYRFEDLLVNYLKEINELDDYIAQFMFDEGEEIFSEYDEEKEEDVLPTDLSEDEIIEAMTDDVVRMIDMWENEDFASMAEFYDLEFGTVGYSDWTYYLAFNGDGDLADDLWNGHNLYTVFQLDENIDIIDSLGMIYARNENELLEQIKMHFDINENEEIYFENTSAIKYLNLNRFEYKPTGYEILLSNKK